MEKRKGKEGKREEWKSRIEDKGEAWRKGEKEG